MWKYVAGSVVVGTVAYGLVKYFAGGVCRCTTRLDGQVVVITGANSGIGKALGLELAKRGATLVLACRNVEKGLEAKKYILSHFKNKSVKIFVKELDLCKISSIVKFTHDLKAEFSEIYALVNNAGVFYHPQGLTEDGFEITLQTNYLGPFILTHYLLDLLKKSVHARIVNVSSEGHRIVNVSDLNALTKCHTEIRDQFIAYGVSKLAINLFTKELSKKLLNTNVIVNAANPGNVETPIFRNFLPLSNPFFFALQWPIRIVVVKSPKQGAQTPLHLLLTSNRTTGQYFTDCKLALSSPISANDKLFRLLKMEEISPDGNITKQVLIKGKWGLKPSENSRCTITITECPSLNHINNSLIIIGDTDGDLWRSVELCLITMEIGEKSKFLILDSGKSISLVIELLDLEFDAYIYDWNTAKKYNLAVHHKEKGNQLFKANNNKEAAFRFIKGLKIIHSIPIDVESIPLSIDGVLVSDITHFKETLYNNLASCYFKNDLWEMVINLCLKVLAYNSNNVKALYKLGVAYEHDRNYEKSFEAFTKLLELEPGNKACTDHLNVVKTKLKKADIRVNNMVKKMFN